MTHQTVWQATQDMPLQERVTAAAQKEAQNNADLNGTERAVQLRATPGYALPWFMFPVAMDYETEYTYAVDSDNPNPGGDDTVITDANLTAAVVTHWPPDPEEAR